MKSLSLHKPHAIVMVGIPGSGKSHFARQFADTFGAPLVDGNELLAAARDEATAATLVRIMLDELLKTNQSVILDVGGDTRRERTDLASYVRSQGYVPLFVWVQTDAETSRQRLARLKDQRASQYEEHSKRFSPPHASEKAVVISGKHTYATQAKAVLRHLSSARAETARHLTTPDRADGDSVRLTIK